MPSLYEKWAMLPAGGWTGRAAENFYRFEDGNMLVKWMLLYMART
jgi:hypothetical protein